MVHSKTLLLVDWDETITEKDTLSLLADAAYQSKPGDDAIPNWSFFVDSYIREYTTHAGNFGDRNTLDQELLFLKSLEMIDLSSVNRVESSGLFRGTFKTYLEQQASNVKVRESWWSIYDRCTQIGVEVIILSVNWSACFIKAAFKLHGCENVEVYANEIDFDDCGVGTGHLSKGQYTLRTGQDKASILQEIKAMNRGSRVIYVGDSSTDLPALLGADIGVIMNTGKGLIEKCRKLKILTEHINTAYKSINEMTLENALYYIDNWSELLTILENQPSE